MIHFTVEHDGDDRELYIEGTRSLVGWIEAGRKMVNQYGTPRREFRFVPALGSNVYPVHTNGIAPCYEEARAFAATLLGSAPVTP